MGARLKKGRHLVYASVPIPTDRGERGLYCGGFLDIGLAQARICLVASSTVTSQTRQPIQAFSPPLQRGYSTRSLSFCTSVRNPYSVQNGA